MPDVTMRQIQDTLKTANDLRLLLGTAGTDATRLQTAYTRSIAMLRTMGATGDIGEPPAGPIVLSNDIDDRVGVTNIPIVSAWQFDQDDNGHMDPEAPNRLANFLPLVYPDANEVRFLILDWESAFFRLVSDGRIPSALDNWEVLRNEALTLRPLARVCLYGVPMFWGQYVAKDNWRRFVEALVDRQLVDAIFQDTYLHKADEINSLTHRLGWLDVGIDAAASGGVPHYCYVTGRTRNIREGQEGAPGWDRIVRPVIREWFDKLLARRTPAGNKTNGLCLWPGVGYYAHLWHDDRKWWSSNVRAILEREIGAEWQDPERINAWVREQLDEMHTDAVAACLAAKEGGE